MHQIAALSTHRLLTVGDNEYRVRLVQNCTYALINDTADILLKSGDIVVFTIRAPGYYSISLRSKTTDISEIATHFGGGGHATSAGFRSRNLKFLS